MQETDSAILFRKFIPLRIIAFCILFCLVPLFLLLEFGHSIFGLLIVFSLVNILIVFFVLKQHFSKKYALDYKLQRLEEETNILSDQVAQEEKSSLALGARLLRYQALNKIIEEIHRNLDLEYVSSHLTNSCFSLIAANKGTCVLYLVDQDTQGLILSKAKKDDRKEVIKAKEGDIFDQWVLRHGTSLFVDDIKKDFRFDSERLRAQDVRVVSSLISAAMMSDYKIFGVLRLDNPNPHSFTQDDLRLLVTISEFGAIALENAHLYQKTQDLAIHDALTGVFTKGHFLEQFAEQLKKSLRQSSVFSLFMIDIDFFKNYNDSFGHIAGDLVLRKLSEMVVDFLKSAVPIVGRFGGEEFCVILPLVDKEKALWIANDLRIRIEREKIILRRQETSITVSIGVACFPSDGRDEETLIAKADKAMYSAKEKGKNRVGSA